MNHFEKLAVWHERVAQTTAKRKEIEQIAQRARNMQERAIVGAYDAGISSAMLAEITGYQRKSINNLIRAHKERSG